MTNDTELYLQRTAAAISTLQNIHQKNSIRNSSLQNSPVSPLSPTRPPIKSIPPSHLPPSAHSKVNANKSHPLHKRNASLDSSRFTTTNVMSTSLQHHLDNNSAKAQLKKSQHQQQQHSRHNSFDGMLTSTAAAVPSQRPTNLKYSRFDQTYDDDDYESMPSRESGSGLPQRQHKVTSIKQSGAVIKQQKHSASPIKRSSSFNMKPMMSHENSSPARAQLIGTPKMNSKFSKAAPSSASSRIQKSASSSCFKDTMNYDEFYINDDDDLNPNNQFTPSDSDDEENQKFSLTMANDQPQPISNTRFNKTFLMRCEQSKNKSGGNKPIGVIACPNTPEMPRRDMTARSSIRERASMPRDSSLNRVIDKKPLTSSKVVVNNNNNSTGNTGGRVTSKYLDISKYKPERGNNFLKRDESKSYLNREVKKSSSSACLQNFQRDVTGRASTRSSSGTTSRPSSATTNKKKEGELRMKFLLIIFNIFNFLVKNTKEVELAMWKRRASYDPLKAAAEGRRKAEEAKRLAQQQQLMLSSER